MKKRILSTLLAACMVFGVMPATAFAADAADPADGAEAVSSNYNEGNVTWLGTQAEYQKTLNTFFNDGMRKVKAGSKWGIVDATGEFIAPPIYDKIELEYVPVPSFEIDRENTNLQRIFIDGYTQCVRNGKYGLLNQYGEEVIPAKYDGVGLPSEGICRIYVKSGGKNYLGYWSLALNREIVAPNKYVDKSASMSKGIDYAQVGEIAKGMPVGFGIPGTPENLRTKGAVQALTYLDFHDGYAFVPTSEDQSVFLEGKIIDKNGKDVLPGGSYLVNNTPGASTSNYPQYGPYLTIMKKSPTGYGAKPSEGYAGHPYWFSGVVGPKGVTVPVTYSGGQIETSGEAGNAFPSVIPDQNLVIIKKDTTPGKYGGGRYGAVNLNNKVVFPFQFGSLIYNKEYNLLLGQHNRDNTGNNAALYTTDGKRFSKRPLSGIDIYNVVNGYARATAVTLVESTGRFLSSKGFINMKTGQDVFILPVTDPNYDKLEYSNFSASGLVWQKNAQGKWGLLNAAGKVVIAHQYDKVEAGPDWEQAKNGYAVVYTGQRQGIVSSAGKVVAPCIYKDILSGVRGSANSDYIRVQTEAGVGLMSILSGQLVIPAVYEDIGGVDMFSFEENFLASGASPVKVADKKYILVSANGNPISGTEYERISESKGGLFSTSTGDYLGPDGKVVFPKSLNYTGRQNPIIQDMTLVVKDGKVGYINADHLAKPTKAKTMAPTKATAEPSSMNLLVNGKSAAVNVYTIGGSSYIKVRDMAYMVNGTGKNFQVAWNGPKNAIELKANTTYTPTAGDMGKGDGKMKSAVRSDSSIYVDGLQRKLTAYNIGGSSFFKLRDVMRVFDIFVGYDNGTITLDTTRGYELMETEKAGMTAPSGIVEAVKTKNKLKIEKLPVTEYYMTKDHAFDTTGMVVTYYDAEGESHNVPASDLTITADGNKITDGYVFQTSNIKDGKITYKGLSATFRIFVYQGVPETVIDPVEGETDQALADGKYTVSCLGNTLSISNGWMVLNGKKPVTLTTKRVGDYYYIYQENTTNNLYVNAGAAGGQLVSNNAVEKFATKWKITHLGGDTYSIRLYDKPEQVVCTGAASSKDGATVILWKNTKTPKHAVMTFTPAK